MIKRILSIALCAVTAVSFAACGSDSDTGENKSEGKSSADIYSYSIKLYGEDYTIPCDLSDFTDNGWSVKEDDKNEFESDVPGTMVLGGYKYNFTNEKDPNSYITLTLVNEKDEEKKASECKVGGIYLNNTSISDAAIPGDLKYNEATVDDVKKLYGEPTNASEDDDKSILTYSQDSDHYVELTFSNYEDNKTKKLITIDYKYALDE